MPKGNKDKNKQAPADEQKATTAHTHHKPAEPTEPVAEPSTDDAATGDAPAFDPPDADKALAWIQPRLATVTDPRWFQVDIEAACVAVLGVCGRCAAPALRKRFENVAKIGEHDITALDDLPLLAVGVRQLRIVADQAIAQATGTKLGADVLAQAREVEDRMQAGCEHTLAKTPKANKELLRLAPGKGYRDDAGDLEGYATLYDTYPDLVKLDGVNYRDGDAALARSLAKKILAALAAAETPVTRAANLALKQGASLLLDAYDEVARVGVFLVGDEDFPSLFTASRAPRRRRRTAATPEPTPSPTPTPTPSDGADPTTQKRIKP